MYKLSVILLVLGIVYQAQSRNADEYMNRRGEDEVLGDADIGEQQVENDANSVTKEGWVANRGWFCGRDRDCK